MTNKLFSLLIIFLLLTFGCTKSKFKGPDTIFSGRVITNGTNDALRKSSGHSNPNVDIYRVNDISMQSERIASQVTDNNGNFSITISLFDEIPKSYRSYYEDGYLHFFFAVSNTDDKYYRYNHWESRYFNFDKNILTPGKDRNEIIRVDAKSFIRFRLIDTNSTADSNQDALKVEVGCLYPTNWMPNQFGTDNFYGKVDTLLSSVPIKKTWSGQTQYATHGLGEYGHYLRAQLTRHGIIKHVDLYYTAPPFDSSIVTIRY